MMGKTKKIIVLTDHMPWGHRSIAKAIYGMIKDNLDVKYIAFNSGLDLWNLWYTINYRFFPGSGRIYFKLSNVRFIAKLLDLGCASKVTRFEKLVNKENPDIIICTYNVFCQILAKIKDRKFKLIVVVADPWKSYNISFAKGADCHLVYDEKMEKKAIDLGINKNQIIKTGWWVRKEMYKKYKKEKNNKPVIFVGGGSLGNSALPKLLLVILGVKKPVKFIIGTGTDKFSYFLALMCKKIIAWIGKDKIIEIEVHGWIDNMVRYLSQSDIVLGKGGPNFIFECMAQEKPFVMVSHIGGQEDGNVELILQKKLGWVKESYGEMKDFLNNYLENPAKYNKMYQNNIKKEALNNKKLHHKLASILAFPR
jgi:UDP-N-acetylglucosamine:LPS N-acetylglucosamine transferase